ncbi:reverse transcriptase [Phytophthora megakarya]|uniref:Reverse transcriptase n=1 Tax=Phytophthora megakarya TaxID=4795 RepID=A0A225VPB8_9STRA|nr:reverse transcriptase [Phytophthora megakarya]
MSLERGIQDIVVVRDSRIVIQQVQGLVNCNQPNLQRRLAECETLKKRFHTVRLVHMKCEFNQAADYLTSKTLVQGKSWIVQDDLERQHLEKIVSKIREQLKAPTLELTVETPYKTLMKKIAIQEPDMVLTLNVPLYFLPPELWLYSQGRELKKLTTTALRPWDHSNFRPNAGDGLRFTKRMMIDNLDKFSSTRLKKISKVADLFVLDDREILYRLPHSVRGRPRDAADNLRLVVPSSLREDMLHYTHEDSQGGHQGITRTQEKSRTEFYWPGMYADVQYFVKECVDCASGKGAPPNAGPSPGNIEPRRPFEAVSMDFVTHMPESARGNTFLLLFQDMFQDM